MKLPKLLCSSLLLYPPLLLYQLKVYCKVFKNWPCSSLVSPCKLCKIPPWFSLTLHLLCTSPRQLNVAGEKLSHADWSHSHLMIISLKWCFQVITVYFYLHLLFFPKTFNSYLPFFTISADTFVPCITEKIEAIITEHSHYRILYIHISFCIHTFGILSGYHT